MIIKNREDLLSHGHTRGRKVAMDVIEHAINVVNPYEIVRKLVRIERERELLVHNMRYDLVKIENIFVVGAGKASFPIAQALEEILGTRIKRGVINVKRGEKRRLQHIKVREAGHPIPDEMGLEGAKEILDIANKAKEGDLVFCIVTGGASAMMPFPVKDIRFEDKKKITALLLKCGATVDEINAVRNHLSIIKGGRLAMSLRRAEVINLMIIDEVAGLPWGPTVPDVTTYEDAIRILKKYNLWKKAPSSVRNYLEKGLTNPKLETPKMKDFKGLRVHNVILGNNESACEAAKQKAQELGFNAVILSTVLEGESREAGFVLTSIAKEIARKGRPVKPPCVLIIGGETTVTITGRSGEGGPSQELALGSSLKLAGNKKIVVAAIDTDGTDGPTEIAGGIIDGSTLERAKEKGIDVYKSLQNHNSSYVLKELKDAIITGPTDTNVMDLNIIVVTT